MIRGEILRTKTAQVSAEHQRATSDLGMLQAREAKARSGVQTREERFWREVAQASAARSDSRRAQGGVPTASITRALEAHRLLKKAKDEHLGLVGEVRHQVSKVLKAKVALDSFTKMQRRERTQREYRMAEHQGEEITEMHSAQRVRLGGYSQRRYDRLIDEGEELSARAAVVTSGVSPGEKYIREAQGDAPLFSTSRSRPLEAPVVVNDSVALHAIQAGNSEHGPTLQMQFESSGTPVACHLASTAKGGIGVVVEAPRGEMLQRVERARAGIVAKLSELGIKISSLEVRRDYGLSNSGGGFLRRGRRTQEERDENVIA